MAIRIESGCVKINDTTWAYTVASQDFPGGIIYVFTASQPPQLGDEIIDGELVPRALVPNPSRDVFQEEWPEPIINNDPGFQKKKMRRDTEVWGRDIDPI